MISCILQTSENQKKASLSLRHLITSASQATVRISNVWRSLGQGTEAGFVHWVLKLTYCIPSGLPLLLFPSFPCIRSNVCSHFETVDPVLEQTAVVLLLCFTIVFIQTASESEDIHPLLTWWLNKLFGSLVRDYFQ